MVKPADEKRKPQRSVQWFLLIPAILFLVWNLLPQSTGTANMTADEQRIAAALSLIEGAGETRVVIYTPESSGFGTSASPIGAVIVAQGAHDLTVQLRLTLAARTLLGLSSSCIQIFPMEDTP